MKKYVILFIVFRHQQQRHLPTSGGISNPTMMSPQLSRLTQNLRHQQVGSPGSSMFEGSSPCKTLTSTLSSPSCSPAHRPRGHNHYQNSADLLLSSNSEANSFMIVTQDGVATLHDSGRQFIGSTNSGTNARYVSIVSVMIETEDI